MIEVTLFAKQKYTGVKNKHMYTKGEKGVWGELGDGDWHIDTIDTVYKIDSWWEHTV